MKPVLCLFFLLVIIGGQRVFSQRWTQIDTKNAPAAGMRIAASGALTFFTDEAHLKSCLPSGTTPASCNIVTIPMPDGTVKNFRVWKTALLPPPLSDKYPDIQTFTGVSVDDPAVTAKLDFTSCGFHAVIFDGDKTSFVDPYERSGGYYLVHYKRDEIRQWMESTKCFTMKSEPVAGATSIDVTTGKNGLRLSNGYQLRSYRLALSCSHQYAQAATGSSNPSVADVLGRMATTMNRVNGVYERELSVTMTFVNNEDTLLYTLASGGHNGDDPFSAINSNASSCLSTNQATCDARIGSSKYDVGHVFTTGAGGLSLIGATCQAGIKAQSATGQPNPVGDGFDIDYVAHEMGHEFGASHSFNSGDGNCAGDNLNPPTAYEPGSGSTIMAYAGICSPDDLQPHSDAYFHAISLTEIQNYLTGFGSTCGVKTPTNNKPVGIPAFAASYNIPYLTPFELTAPAASDSVADTSTTYCWEEWDLGNPGAELVNTHQLGPIFRSYTPVRSATRVFPKDTMVLTGILSNAGKENHEGEKVPDVARILTFKLTLRDICNGYGCYLIPDDSILLNVVNTGAGFTVTSQNDSGAIYIGNTTQTITWNVANTNTGMVNTPKVDIFMSDDGGYTWKYQVGTFPNTGSATVPLPNPPADISAARIKVKGSGNVFFNVNKYNFGVSHAEGTNTSIKLYPVPAHTTLRIFTGSQGEQQFAIYNAVGKLMCKDVVYGIYDVPVNLWPRGLYVIRLVDDNKHRTIKKFVVD